MDLPSESFLDAYVEKLVSKLKSEHGDAWEEGLLWLYGPKWSDKIKANYIRMFLDSEAEPLRQQRNRENPLSDLV